ncbi:hypothetical protein ABH935_009963 [Catenulispora sp. GAS73]
MPQQKPRTDSTAESTGKARPPRTARPALRKVLRTGPTLKPLSRPKRFSMALITLIMLLIGVAYLVTHRTDLPRQAGWIGRSGHLTIVQCDPVRLSRGSVVYDCSGVFTSGNGSTPSALAHLNDTSSSQYPFGKVLKVTFDGDHTAYPVGFRPAVDALAKLMFVGVAITGIGILLAGLALGSPDGWRRRVAGRAFLVGFGLFLGGCALALLLAVIGLF